MKRYQLALLGAASLALVGCANNYSSHTSTHYRQVDHHFPAQREASTKPTFVFSPKHLAWAAYDESGQLVRTGPASGGQHVCPESNRSCRTVVGRFSVRDKGDEGCASSKYPLGSGGAPMPYCMHFYKGFAIHGTDRPLDRLGSHGCIGISTSAARWLNEEFLEVGSPVIVHPY